MKFSRTLLKAALGSRLPQHEGELRLRGPRDRIRILRDRYGIPYIQATNDEDAWFGQGFCQGQDRAFQLEALSRVSRGTISELIGEDGIGIDRLSRRVGFHRHAKKQLENLSPEIRRMIESFAAGVTAGKKKGCPRPHEFAILMRRRTPFQAEDTLGILGVMNFLLVSNWDSELTRLEILERDGPEALAAIDRPYPEWLTTTTRPGMAVGVAPGTREMLHEARELGSLLGLGGGSNNWVLAPSRTSTGRPILANDPHLGPLSPPQWYLSSIQAPGWRLVGAAFAGTPGISSGHNGHVAWGVTAGMVDTTDLFLEELGPGGTTVREGEKFVPCKVIRERIRVRGPWGHRNIDEDVSVTPRGPVLGAALGPGSRTLSMKATWLEGLPVRGILALKDVRTFEQFQEAFTDWPSITLNFVYADQDGHIGWQLTGVPPIRKAGSGAIPAPGWDSRFGWKGIAKTSDLPSLKDPAEGYIATANACPIAESKIDIGCDFLDGYRMARIQHELAKRSDWDIASTSRLQLDQYSLVWQEIREKILGALAEGPASRERRMLEAWNGVIGASSSEASIYEFLLHEMIARATRAKAPNSAEVLLGSSFVPGMIDAPLYSFRRHGWIVRLLREGPAGWFEHGWSAEIREAFDAAVKKLKKDHGEDPARWTWGELRGLEIRHPLGKVPILRPVFNLGPFPWGGDTNTIAQATNGTLDPLDNPGAISNLRTAIDVGAWDNSRFVLCGGQVGNPCSPHYDDLLELWKKGEGTPIAWSETRIRELASRELTLLPH